MTGKGDLRINGMPVSGEWELCLNDDYVDTTTFGSTNKTYLASRRSVDLSIKDWGGVATASGSPYKPEREAFDFEAAREMYEDDPVALAIIKRMHTMELALDMFEMTISGHDDRWGELAEEYAALAKENERMRSMLYRDPEHRGQWAASDPVKKRNKGIFRR